MNRIFLLVLIISGCTVNRNYFIDNNLLKLPKDDLTILTTLEFIKHDNPDCKGDCVIQVACTYKYIDKCLMY